MIDLTAQFSHLRQLNSTHLVSSLNIANVNTPGYDAMELDFESVLHPNDPVQLKPQDEDGNHTRLDGNNVSIDRELGALKKNALAHSAYSQLLSFQIQQLRRAISGQ